MITQKMNTSINPGTLQNTNTNMRAIITLVRLYRDQATIGAFLHNNFLICKSIELPWLSNKNQDSCIPEGLYKLTPYISKKFGQTYQVQNVKNRSGILIHPANDAKKELKGSIAPVTSVNNDLTGNESRKATEKINNLIKCYQDINIETYLYVTSNKTPYEKN